MNFWKMICRKWSREEIASWPSLKKTAYILLPLLIYFLVHDAVELVLWAGLDRFLLRCSEGTKRWVMDHSALISATGSGAAVVAGTGAVWKAVRTEISGQAQKRQEGTKMVKAGMQTAALAFLAALGFNLLFTLLGITESSQTFEETARAQFRVPFLAGLFLYGLLSPLTEEAIFRGLIYNRMKRCFRYPVALAVSSLLFGCYHGNVVQALYGTILGLLIADIYETQGSFAMPVLFHGIANISIFTMSYNHWLSGADESLSMALTVIFLGGAAVCLWRIHKSAAKN